MGIVALGIALGYLLVVAVCAIGALLVVIWLFGNAPCEGTRTGVETVECSRGAEDRRGAAGLSAPSVRPRSSAEDKAA